MMFSSPTLTDVVLIDGSLDFEPKIMNSVLLSLSLSLFRFIHPLKSSMHRSNLSSVSTSFAGWNDAYCECHQGSIAHLLGHHLLGVYMHPPPLHISRKPTFLGA